VKIRVVQVRNGKPLRNEPIEVSFEGMKSGLELTTGADGTAEFRLPSPAPRRFFVLVRLKSEEPDWSCECGRFFDTQAVLDYGYVCRTTENIDLWKRPDPDIKPVPGEIVFRPRRVPLLLRPLWLMLST
jgi:hypothetical protein